MGAGSSKTTIASPDASIGKFRLSIEEQKNIDVLSYLFQNLLEKNNLMDMKSLIEENRCDNLIAILSSQINKEFQSLRFPDPSDVNQLRITSFISKDKYEKLASSDYQKKMCDDIAEFLFRFVVLIGSLTVSISIPKGIPKLGEAKDEIVKLKETIPFRTVQDDVLTDLKFIENLGSGVYKLSDEYFLNQSGSIYHVSEDSDKTKLAGVKIRYWRYDTKAFDDITQQQAEKLTAEEKEKRMKEQREALTFEAEKQARTLEFQRQFQQGQTFPSAQTQPQPAPTPLPVNATNVPQAAGRRKTYRKKRNSKLTRKYRKSGGADEKYYLFEFYDLLKCNASAEACSSISSVVIDVNGNSWTKDFFINSSKFGTVTVKTSDSKPLEDVLESLFSDKLIDTVDTEVAQRVSENDSRSNTNFSMGTEAEQLLAKLSKAVLTGNEILSPAAYRAYLLTTQVSIENPKAIITSFCNDVWTTTSLNKIPAYTFLEGLYYGDIASGEKSMLVEKFKGDGLVSVKDVRGAAPNSFKTLFFQKIKKNPTLSAFCAKNRQDTSLEEHKRILTGAYKALQLQYSQHVANVFTFLKTLIVVDSDFMNGIQTMRVDDSRPIIRLNPVFVQHAAGSRVALNEKIAEARKMLVKHYYAVEKIYRQAIDMFGNATTGNVSTPPSV